jgi:Cu(I)/Ag(I) efflux system membrane protein CusA/SilA
MFTRLGSEFMPPLDEGSILFMPVTLPDVSNSVKRIAGSG